MNKFKLQYFSKIGRFWGNLSPKGHALGFDNLDDVRAYRCEYLKKHPQEQTRIVKVIWISSNELKEEVIE